MINDLYIVVRVFRVYARIVLVGDSSTAHDSPEEGKRRTNICIVKFRLVLDDIYVYIYIYTYMRT